MQNNNIFSHFQYGFIPIRSTTLQLLKIKILDDWTKALYNGYTTLKKAFDKLKCLTNTFYTELLSTESVTKYGSNLT